jgi:hypothetical protein
MSLHRVTLFALAALFSAAMTSAASAGCCGWGVQAPVTYAPAPCGGCGTPSAAIVYATPVAPAPPPVVVSAWAGGCGCSCGCRGFIGYAAPAVEVTPVAPAPIYVVNQGPDYTGPGIMVPYHTWAPAAGYVAPGAYPYAPGYGYGYGYYGPRRVYVAPHPHAAAYHAGFYGHPYYRGRVRPYAYHPHG